LSYEACRRPLGPVVHALYGLEVRGAEHVPATGPLVVACNHESMLDPFVLGAAIPRSMRFLAKSELWRVPLVRAVLDSAEAIPVRRGRSDMRAVEAAVAALGAGQVVAIFPEGGVVREGGRWLRGAARMALASGAPLLPVRLLGTRRALGDGAIRFPPLAVLIGEPIAVERDARPTVAAARALTARLQAAVTALGS
jgi:1-acyl-sn-glycerol-3-phosphate acyltransferase